MFELVGGVFSQFGKTWFGHQVDTLVDKLNRNLSVFIFIAFAIVVSLVLLCLIFTLCINIHTVYTNSDCMHFMHKFKRIKQQKLLICVDQNIHDRSIGYTRQFVKLIKI